MNIEGCRTRLRCQAPQVCKMRVKRSHEAVPAILMPSIAWVVLPPKPRGRRVRKNPPQDSRQRLLRLCALSFPYSANRLVIYNCDPLCAPLRGADRSVRHLPLRVS
ncbi:hypothetical protein J2W34_004258 [Variovorax boronicumulans]|nr:hypothetical protein [Variovorax boronicumulans]